MRNGRRQMEDGRRGKPGWRCGGCCGRRAIRADWNRAGRGPGLRTSAGRSCSRWGRRPWPAATRRGRRWRRSAADCGRHFRPAGRRRRRRRRRRPVGRRCRFRSDGRGSSAGSPNCSGRPDRRRRRPKRRRPRRRDRAPAGRPSRPTSSSRRSAFWGDRRSAGRPGPARADWPVRPKSGAPAGASRRTTSSAARRRSGSQSAGRTTSWWCCAAPAWRSGCCWHAQWEGRFFSSALVERLAFETTVTVENLCANGGVWVVFGGQGVPSAFLIAVAQVDELLLLAGPQSADALAVQFDDAEAEIALVEHDDLVLVRRVVDHVAQRQQRRYALTASSQPTT